MVTCCSPIFSPGNIGCPQRGSSLSHSLDYLVLQRFDSCVGTYQHKNSIQVSLEIIIFHIHDDLQFPFCRHFIQLSQWSPLFILFLRLYTSFRQVPYNWSCIIHFQNYMLGKVFGDRSTQSAVRASQWYHFFYKCCPPSRVAM